MRVVAAIGVMLALSGCGGGGGGGGGTGIDPRLLRLDEYEAQRLRVLGDPAMGVPGMDETAAAAVPTAGAVDYRGGVTVRVDTAAPITLYGDAALTVDFATPGVAGDFTRFFGTTSDGSVIDYAGSISVSGDTATQNPVLAYAGGLSGGAVTLAFDGTLNGAFLGPGAEALVASDLGAEVIADGMSVDASVVMITEAVLP